MALSWLLSPDSQGGQTRSLAAGYYRSLYSGGLLKTMLDDVRSSDPGQILRSRAAAYAPKSALHLHLDALELLSFRGSLPTLPNERIVAIAGARIFELLYLRWGERAYPTVLQTVYAELPSEKLAEWEALSEAERERRLAEPAFAWEEDPEAAMRGSLERKPSRTLLGPEAEATPGRIYRLLFAIGADGEFLRGEALSAWAIDLASAGATAVALFFAGSPYVTQYREQVIIAAIDSLLFGCHIDGVASEHRAQLWGGDVEELLRTAMNEVTANWDEAAPARFFAARESYQAEMRELSVNVADLYNMGRAASTASTHSVSGRRTRKIPEQSLQLHAAPGTEESADASGSIAELIAKLANSSR